MLTEETDNIDYNALKHFIKSHTTRDQATAIAIPGHQDTALSRFEDELYRELCHQHDRVGLFVSTKADELGRRLRRTPPSLREMPMANRPPRWLRGGPRILLRPGPPPDSAVHGVDAQPRLAEAPAALHQVRARDCAVRRRDPRPVALRECPGRGLPQDPQEVQGQFHPRVPPLAQR